MRFPLGFTEEGFPRYKRLSDALQESLMDCGIIDPVTRRPMQEWFKLDIPEGPLLECLAQAFELRGDFHVGCTADIRPPSFSFSASAGADNSREGSFTIIYGRMLKEDVFLDNASFRKASAISSSGHVRDLEALAKAYQRLENYEESVGLHWNGWTGDETPHGKCGFRHMGVSVTFTESVLIDVDHLYYLTSASHVAGGPRYAVSNPFYEIGDGTVLKEIVRACHAGNGQPKSVRVSDVIYGIIQLASKVIPPKADIIAGRALVTEACTPYRMAERVSFV